MTSDSASSNPPAWVMVKAVTGRGLPLIIRVRTDLGDAGQRAKWPERMTVTWTYPIEDESTRKGLPTNDQLATMDKFEDAAFALEQSEVAVLTSVTTTAGTREWVWYCAGTPEFNKAFNAALKGHARYPLVLRSNPDPEWAEYRRLLEAIRRKG